MNLFVFKLPPVQGPDHVGHVSKALKECEAMAPKHCSAEAVAHFNHIMNQCADIPTKCRNALKNYLFLGDPDPNDKLEDDYVDFIIKLSSGLPIDESFLVDGRHNNSRGGKGIGSTQFKKFFDVCREILKPNSVTDERRHGDVIHASGAHSVPDLHKQVSRLYIMLLFSQLTS